MNENTNNALWHFRAPEDSGPGSGTLNEMRVAFRPSVSVGGWSVNAGSTALENYQPIEDAAVVKRIRDQGARLVGMSRMSELGFGITSETSHLLFLQDKCDVFLGTDAAGETRHTASLAGAWGYKPSFGICPNLGTIRLIPSMESIGVIADTPARIAAVLSVVSGKENIDFSMLQDNPPDFSALGSKNSGADEKGAKIRIGVISEQVRRLNETDKNAFDKAVDKLAQKGLPVQTVSFPEYDWFRKVHQIAGSVEASSSAGKYDGVRYGHRAGKADNWNEMYLKSRQEAFGTLIKSYLFQGAFFQFENFPAFEQACRMRNHLVKKTGALFTDIDFIASPVRCSGADAADAKTVDDVYDAFAHTLPANVIGLPALTAPGIVATGDGDLGFQLAAPHLSDAALLHFAMTYLPVS
ncbi:MAG: amidase [Desulfosalsimonadaceae bacterium]